MPNEPADTTRVFMDKDTGKVRVASCKKTTKPIDPNAETVIPLQPEPLLPESGEFECFSVERSYPDHLSDSVVQAQSVANEPLRQAVKETDESVGNFAKALKRLFTNRKQKSEERKHHAEGNGSGSSPNLGVAG